jgi:phosphoserine phosphatase RsbX
LVEWGLDTRIAPGAQESGDLHVVQTFPEGMLLGALDGLGHGVEAAVASRLGAAVLRAFAGEPLDELVSRCHVALRGTRGVTLSLCRFDERASTWSWVGVGNVSGVLVREGRVSQHKRQFLIQSHGVVGGSMSKPTVSTVPAIPGDVMVLATDGVHLAYSDELNPMGTPKEIAERILDEHATGKDDALAVVVRFTGGSP